MGEMRGRPRPGQRPIETALRYLATRDRGVLVELLRHAIDRPQSSTGAALAPLTEPTAILDGWSAAERAHAVWQVIREGVHAPDVSPTVESRRRRALYAAFRLPDPDIHDPWGSSLTERFKQLRVLKSIFNNPDSLQPMEMAWRRAVGRLADYVETRFGELRTAADWSQYRPRDRGLRDHDGGDPEVWKDDIEALDGVDSIYRRPSRGAQPVFVHLFVTTVFMKRRAVYRRITERLISAREDGVSYYTARGFAGTQGARTYVPVRALWGCTAEFIEIPGRPAVTRLWLPSALRKGEKAHFASEIVDVNVMEERNWVDVDIDHHGIAPGRTHYGGRFPISGLTIRVRFDEGCLPEAVWWYAELNENERYDRPPQGDRHLLPVIGNDVQYTFKDQVCQPRESYGLAFKWPASEEAGGSGQAPKNRTA
jgi:hypothetical protein